MMDMKRIQVTKGSEWVEMDQMLPEVQNGEEGERGYGEGEEQEEGRDGEKLENSIQTEENICNIKIVSFC